MTKGIITKGVGGLYTVMPIRAESGAEPMLCRARGRFRLDGITPLPGDEVQILPTGDSEEIPEGMDTLPEEKQGKKDKVTAIVVADVENYTLEQATEAFEKDVKKVNKRLAKYKQIQDYRVTDVEFNKTSTGKVKRY